MPDTPTQTQLEYLITTLQEAYGRQTRYSTKTAIDQLVATILSQRTNYADEKAAYDKLLATYGNWGGVAGATVEGIEQCIQTSRWPEIKAPRIKEILTHIQDTYGDLNLDFLADMPVEEAQALLMELPGVGFKTATFVLLFSLRMPVLPVDTHVHRVSTRFGILPAKISQAKAHGALLEILPRDADELLNFHKLLFRHGQRVCTYSHPRCGDCVVRERCRYFLERVTD
ncbi:endonuclease III domain-containing protein [Neolewinella litorea]|uniref:Endonuclease III n=1 Tax=Neolewinella litorea TaxID=2562452 RepID=A0A4S4NI10_9BACT|nr:endonuclease III [Neolewinella litorea]THH37841.1 endonuclease III [Neolewinella litorea]